MKSIQPADAAKEHFAPWNGTFEISLSIELAALQAIVDVIHFKRVQLRVKLADTGIGAQPKIAVLIRQRGVDCVVAEAAVAFTV